MSEDTSMEHALALKIAELERHIGAGAIPMTLIRMELQVLWNILGNLRRLIELQPTMLLDLLDQAIQEERKPKLLVAQQGVPGQMDLGL